MTSTATRTETLLSIEHVSLSYGPVQVLRDVNVHIDNLVRPGITTGQVVAFLGPSGCGKTSLLRIIAGLQEATSGSVWLGKDREPAHPGAVGLVSQQYLLYRNRDILSNLVVSAKQAKDRPSAAVAKQRAVDILNEFGLLDKAHMYLSQLSGGQRQRVSIGQQILCSDHFLLMDEPTAGLDPLAKETVCRLIGETANRDDLETIIIVTHDIPSAVAVADTICVIGRDRDSKGGIVPGARIVDTYDMIARGITWHENIHQMPEFAETVEELQDRFKSL